MGLWGFGLVLTAQVCAADHDSSQEEGDGPSAKPDMDIRDGVFFSFLLPFSPILWKVMARRTVDVTAVGAKYSVPHLSTIFGILWTRPAAIFKYRRPRAPSGRSMERGAPPSRSATTRGEKGPGTGWRVSGRGRGAGGAVRDSRSIDEALERLIPRYVYLALSALHASTTKRRTKYLGFTPKEEKTNRLPPPLNGP